MDTRVLAMGSDPSSWEEALLDAADILRHGGLVAFPTETVYGLGANALDEAAVQKIYEAKGRPAHNPVIVHVHSMAQAKTVVTQWNDTAEKLTKAFWPGPLTIILPRAAHVPPIVSAGGPTIALRMPSHPIALALLKEANIPLAAPSANASEGISPTSAAHVLKSLDGKLPLILDGGPTTGGIESTVVDCTKNPAVILRSGLISREEIAAVWPVTLSAAFSGNESLLSSPGMMKRHYAPSIPLMVVSSLEEGLNKNCSYLVYGEYALSVPGTVERLPEDPKGYAAGLYAALHRLEDSGCEKILVLEPPHGNAWEAIHDRLRRAAAPRG